MTAVFGKLDGSQLQLQPGLNIIYAPNESGKSTWSHFIRTMLYGLPTRDRGLLADKNRFAPWDGTAMSGRMDLQVGADSYTVVRRTQRASSPMGDFSCTYTGTADAVAELNGQNLGETLLGVGRDVFVRSAFISQSGLALDKDAELERRIAALITSGEEDISYSEVQERLKKQLNRRRHNKTGLIPALEQEINGILSALEHLQALHQQEEDARLQLAQYERQVGELQQRLEQWELLKKQEALRSYLQAQDAAQAATAHAQALQAADPALPESSELARLEGMADALDQRLQDAEKSAESVLQLQQTAETTQTCWQQHPLYPATQAQLDERLLAAAAKPQRFSVPFALVSLAASGGIGYGAWHFLQQLPYAIAIGAAVFAAALLIYNSVRCRRNKTAAAKAEAKQAELQAQINEYLSLQQRYEAAHSEAEQAVASARSLQQSCQEGLLQLLSLVRPFAPESTNLTNLRSTLHRATAKRRAIDGAVQAAREAQLQQQLLEQHLPQGPLPDPTAALPRPTASHAQIAEALPRAMAGAQAARSRLDALTGQLQASGDRDALESRLQQKREELSRLQGEYDAIVRAMEALTHADQTLQNRFSPELGRLAAEIFGQLTGGRYQQVLFDRSFSLSAAPTGDTSARDIRLLSQGAADQLYLATRLAICHMVLPAENAVPLILDDALANFDNERMAAALEWLVQEAQQRQILLFTCHTREGEYLSGRSGVHHLTL